MTEPSPLVASLETAAVMRVAGRDAQSFLHAQLTQDITTMSAEQARLAAWADARGRVRAVLRVLRLDDGWLLITTASLVPALLNKLRMFVLRADVTIEASEELAVFALTGNVDQWLRARSIALPAEPGAVAAAHGISWVRIGAGLVQAIGAPEAVRSVCAGLEEAPPARVELDEIRLGLPAIGTGLTERYVPQMLNLDELGAVSFRKGCYPGQEVIARTQNLGTVKRRLRRLASQSSQVPAPGTAIVDGDGVSAGEVVRAAPAEHGIEMLAVARIDARAETLHVADDPAVLSEPG
jgi:tRNA-modifying protein YgfZ